MPRVVRLGRPANDNARGIHLPGRLLVVLLAMALVAFALFDWQLI